MGVPGLIGGIQPFAELHDGSTTTVYKGYQSSLQRFVLLKVLKPAFSRDEEIAGRFKEEARLVAQIQHPNVVAIYDYGEDEDRVYFAAEYVDGSDLGELIGAAGIPPELAVFILMEAARGLKAAHAKGIIHRDLKPGNLLIGQEGRVKLADFGMASLMEDEADRQEVRGTPAYLAPEQIAGETPTEASDLFALGAILFEMLTGRTAFRGEETGDIFQAVRSHDPMRQLEMQVGLPDELYDLARRLLAKDRADRYDSAATLVEDLRAFRYRHGVAVGEKDLQSYLDDPEAYRKAARQPLLPSVLVAEPIGEGVPERPATEPPEPPREDTQLLWRQSGHVLAAAVVLLLSGWIAFHILGGEPSPERAEPVASASDSLLAHAENDTVSTSVQASTAVSTSAVDSVLEGPSSDGGEEQDEEEQMGRLRVDSDPAADVYVSGELIGTTPLTAPVQSGVHTLVLQRDDLPEYRGRVRVRPDQETQTTVSLWSQVGRLLVETLPGTVLVVDGRERDTTPQTQPLILAPGTHELTLRHADLGTRTETIRIDGGAYDTLRVEANERIGW